MICLKCDCEEFVLQEDAEIEQEFKGKTLKIRTPVMACKNCGWQWVTSSQADELRQRTVGAYRRLKASRFVDSLEMRFDDFGDL